MARIIFDNYVDLNSFHYLIFLATIGVDIEKFFKFSFSEFKHPFSSKKFS